MSHAPTSLEPSEGKGAGLELLYRSPEVSALIAADALRPLAQDQRLSVPEPATAFLAHAADLRT